MNRIIYMAACAALLVSCDCEFDMTTIVDRDGSITRIISCPADSAFMCGDTIGTDECPIAITSDWELSWMKDGERRQWPVSVQEYGQLCRGSKPVVDISRRFESARQMNSLFQFDALPMPVRPVAGLTKKVKLFHTEYTYTETFPRYESFSVPVTDYMSMDDAILFFQGSPDMTSRSGSVLFDRLSELTDSVSRWFAANFLDEAFRYLARNYGSIKDAPMSEVEFLAKRDAFIRYPVSDLEGSSLGRALDDFFGTDVYSNYIKGITDDAFQTQIMAFVTNLPFDYTVVMPGTVIPAPGLLTDGNTATFHMNVGMIYPADYTVTVSSRTQNVWAYALLFVVLAAAFIGIPMASSGRRRSEKGC